MTDLYRPKKGLRVPMPGNQPDWPQDGRPIDPLSAYEKRLVESGDLVLIEPKEPEEDNAAGSKKPAGSSGGTK